MLSIDFYSCLDDESYSKEGGESESRFKDLQKKTTNTQKLIIDPNVAYNPDYSVFNTTEKPYFIKIPEEVFSEEVDDEEGLSKDDDLNLKFKKVKTENIMINPFGKLIEDQDAMKQLRQKYRGEIISAGSLKRSHFRDSEQMETDYHKDLTKEEIAIIKQKEREQYYRENLKNKRTVLNIKAIEFDWIFGTEGVNFIKTIAESKDVQIFEIGIIKTIILFFWKYYKRRIVIASFLPFMLNFLAMFAYATYIHYYNNNRNNNATTDWQNFNNWDSMKYADYALMLTILLLAFYQFILELLYLFQIRLKYFISFWNLVNLMSIGLNVASISLDYKNTGESQYWIPVSSSAMIIMWLRLFYFGRIINATSTIVRMIIEISKDMIPFLIIVFIIVFGFTNSFFVIATITYDDSPRFTTNNFFLAVAWTWRNGIGDFQPADFSANRYLHLCKVIWLLCTFFVMIVFLNLLIAVLSDSFDKIQETLENNLLKEMAIMMSENEILINRKRTFHGMKYMFIIEKSLSKSKKDGWGGKLDYINQTIKKMTESHVERLNSVNENIETIFDINVTNKVGKLEQRTEKSLNYINGRVEKLDTDLRLYKEYYYYTMKNSKKVDPLNAHK